MYDNIVFRAFVKITYCDKAFLIKDYHHHHQDPSLRIESSAIINLRGVSTKLNKHIVFIMETYKKQLYNKYMIQETFNCC